MIKRENYSDKIFDFINMTLLILALIIVGYPLIYILSASLSDSLKVVSGEVWLWPVGFNLEGYKAVFQYKIIWLGYGNTIFYTVVGTTINLVLMVLAGYPLSRKDLYGRKPIMFLFVFTMMFNGGLIPTYLNITNLGLINTRWSLLLPFALVVWNMVIARTYFANTIPNELLEASQIDGCTDFGFLTKVVIPLSGPILAVMTLFHAVFHWNQYFQAMMYLNDKELFPLQLFLREILIMNQMSPEMLSSLDPTEAAAREALSELLQYSLIVIASLPVILIYPLVQKYFVKGMMVGAIKG